MRHLDPVEYRGITVGAPLAPPSSMLSIIAFTLVLVPMMLNLRPLPVTK